MSIKILTLRIKYENDIVLARQRARLISKLMGFDVREQTAISTSVSEIARNTFNYAGGGVIEFLLDEKASPQIFLIKVTDEGPGIADLDKILNGNYVSKTGMGMGIVGSRRLMDYFHIESKPQKGTAVILGKTRSKANPQLTAADISGIAGELAKSTSNDPMDEITQQNQELLSSLDEIRKRQEELERVNRELEETNRGVVALYAELDEKAEHLRQVNEIKARFFSNMSHEFRTPLNSIIGLSKLLLDRIDGNLTEEQEKQVKFIKKSADELYETVNDLLDLAKAESGKLTVKASGFFIPQLFSTLRGSFKPLVMNAELNLIFEESDDLLELFTDEAKVTQILRNFISNAIKFTPKGEIRVKAQAGDNNSSVIFSVSDTGIGIAEKDIEYIFEEFSQIETELQRKTKGTGLGLPLTKKLAEILGGNVWVESKLGSGSVFHAKIPVDYNSLQSVDRSQEILSKIDLTKEPVLIIEDNAPTLLIYEKHLEGTGFQVLPARTIREARSIMAIQRPKAIIMDLLLPGEDPWGFLHSLKSNENTKDIPVIVASILEDEQKGLTLGVEDYWVKPVNPQLMLKKLNEIKSKFSINRILIVDDDEISRYLLKGFLSDTKYEIIEASNGNEGYQMALSKMPDLIFLDLIMPDLTGFEVLEMLKSNSQLADIPVIINTSKELTAEESGRLRNSANLIVNKRKWTETDTISEIKSTLLKTLNIKKE
ncbi:MAG: ATP-binding protein [Bacillota bacterium]